MTKSVKSDLLRIIVLVPDLRLDGGVTNYYRTLLLNEIPEIEYFYVNKLGANSWLQKIISVFQVIYRFTLLVRQYDIVHVNPSLDAKSFFRDMALILVARLAKKKILVFFRGWQYPYQAKIQANKLLQFLFMHSYAKAERFIVLGQCFKEGLHALGVSADTPIHIETTVADSNGIESLDLTKKMKTAESGLKCLFLSRVLRDKGVFIAIDAVGLCSKKNPQANLSLTIAGEGPDLAAAKAYVTKKDLKNVYFVGSVSGTSKLKLLVDSHIMLFPSFYGEGLPNCILEGMLFGMPILSRFNAAIPEVVKDQRNGFLTQSKEGVVFSDYLTKLLEQPQLLFEIAKANNELAEQRFVTERVKYRIVDIYKKMNDVDAPQVMV